MQWDMLSHSYNERDFGFNGLFNGRSCLPSSNIYSSRIWFQLLFRLKARSDIHLAR